jgi:hypothetical protein
LAPPPTREGVGESIGERERLFDIPEAGSHVVTSEKN